MKFVCKDIKNPSTGNENSYVFLQKKLKRNRPFAVFLNTTNTYIKNLQEKHKGTLKNCPAADSSAARLFDGYLCHSFRFLDRLERKTRRTNEVNSTT